MFPFSEELIPFRRNMVAGAYPTACWAQAGYTLDRLSVFAGFIFTYFLQYILNLSLFRVYILLKSYSKVNKRKNFLFCFIYTQLKSYFQQNIFIRCIWENRLYICQTNMEFLFLFKFFFFQATYSF